MRSVLRLLASGLVLSFLSWLSVFTRISNWSITGVVTDQSGAL